MANSAFDHTAAITVPSSSTNTGVVTWSGTGGNTLLDSTVLVSGNNITIPGTITFGGTQITSTAARINFLSVSGLAEADFTKLAAVDATAAELNLLNGVSGLVQADLTKLAAIDSTAAEVNLLNGVSGLVQADLTKLAAIDSTAAEVNLLDAITRGSIIYGNASGATALLGKGTNGQVLTSNATDVLWADAAGGGVDTTGTPANNQIATFTDADTLQGEASLTFDNAALAFSRNHDGNNAINLINDSNTSSASTRLTIQCAGASAGDAVALFHAGGQSYIIGVDNSDGNKFKISATGGNLGTNDALTIIPDGSGGGSNNAYFGIGTSTPVRPLDIRYPQSRAQLRLARTGSATGEANLGAGDGMFSIMDSGYTRRFSVMTATGAIGIGLGNSTPTGNFHLKVGASGASPHSAYNHVSFENSGRMAVNIVVPSNSEGHFGFAWPSYSQGAGCYTNSNSGSGYYAIQVHGGEKLRIASSGNVTGAHGTYHTSSDSRIKENVADITFGLSHVLQMRPVSFNFTDWYDRDGVQETRLGFIAQEVKAVVPNAVKVATQTMEFNYDDDNDVRTVLHEPITDMHSIEDTQMIPVLVKAIQELKAEIDELKG